MLLALTPACAAAMPLREAVRMGLAIHPDLKAAQAEVDAAETDVRIARNGYYPALSVSAGPRNSALDGFTYDVTASQAVYDWGRVTSRVRGARAAERQIVQDGAVRRDEAVLDIVDNYLAVLLARAQIEADRRHIARLDQVEQMTEARSRGGYADRSEPERAALERARAEDRLLADRGRLRDAENQFETLVGAPPEALAEPHPQSMERYAERADLERLIAEAPLYRKAAEDVHQAEAELRGARAALLPQVNVEASLQRRDIGGRLLTDSIVGLRLRMNNIQGLSPLQQVTGARQRIAAAQWRQSAVARDLRRQVRTLLDTAERIGSQTRTLEAQVEGADKLGALYQEQFQVGRRDVIDLLNIQRERFEAERQLIETHFQLVGLQYRIASTLGLIEPLIEGGLG